MEWSSTQSIALYHFINTKHRVKSNTLLLNRIKTHNIFLFLYNINEKCVIWIKTSYLKEKEWSVHFQNLLVFFSSFLSSNNFKIFLIYRLLPIRLNSLWKIQFKPSMWIHEIQLVDRKGKIAGLSKKMFQLKTFYFFPKKKKKKNFRDHYEFSLLFELKKTIVKYKRNYLFFFFFFWGNYLIS